MDSMSEMEMGANILLAHFHYSCKGYRIFEQGWRAEETRSMELNAEQVQFIQKTAAYVKANSMFIPCYDVRITNTREESHFAEVLEQKLVEHQHYFVAQLYEEDWKPRSTIL